MSHHHDHDHSHSHDHDHSHSHDHDHSHSHDHNHSHSHDHDHSHSHDHDHSHSHSHHKSGQVALTFEDKLAKILDHWLGHNTDHAATYKDWAQKAADHGMDEVSKLLEEAAEMTLAINAKFEEAAKKK